MYIVVKSTKINLSVSSSSALHTFGFLSVVSIPGFCNAFTKLQNPRKRLDFEIGSDSKKHTQQDDYQELSGPTESFCCFGFKVREEGFPVKE